MITKLLSILMLIFAIGFNLWLYRLEPMATIDPNDNPFQYALVHRTSDIWNFAAKTCSGKLTYPICFTGYLVDHWVPNWAEGYNLPFYYSHLPQIAIVTSYKFINFINFIRPPLAVLQGEALQNAAISLFQYYHWIIYLLLSFFPLSMFIALRVIGAPWLIAGFGALIASHLSTDGLYGLDPPSFLWRGYGLSSQLFAMIWLPLALAYSYKFLNISNGQRAFFEQLKIFLGIRSQTAGENLHLVSGKKATNYERPWRTGSKNASWELEATKNFWLAVIFVSLTTTGHLGVGIMTLMSIGVLAVSQLLFLLLTKSSVWEIIPSLVTSLYKLFFLAGTTIFFLSYWIVPLLLNNDYHNISFWDPVWKFDSYGAHEVLTNLFNGALFDFGRFPWLTILTILGSFSTVTLLGSKFFADRFLSARERYAITDNLISQASSGSRKIWLPNSEKSIQYGGFSLLFLFWLLMYFGRTTWGGLIDLIPGMKEFHLSRFLVGVQISGLFLAPLGLWWLIESVTHKLTNWLARILEEDKFNRIKTQIEFVVRGSWFVVILLLILPPIYRQTIEYSRHNDRLIKQANDNHLKVLDDEKTLFATFKTLAPGRIFAGRGGGYGKDFQIAETTYFMHLSTYGLPTTLWLPETWSPNSDIEQYFSEDQLKDYQLFGIRYTLAPPDLKPQPFWQLIKETASWKLYEIPNVTYFTSGVRPAIVASDKQSFVNLVRLWIQTDQTHVRGLYPELTFNLKDYPKSAGLPNFRMIDEANYIVPDGSTHNLFAEPPVYLPAAVKSIEEFKKITTGQYTNIKITNEQVDSDMIFTANVEVTDPCGQCIVVLKQTFHPNWQATIDGKLAETFTVFPFYIGVKLDTPGFHSVRLAYEPSVLKISLMTVALITFIILISWSIRYHLSKI